MRKLLLLAMVTAVAGAAVPAAGAKTAPLRQVGSTVDNGRAGGTWTAWKVKGKQVGLRMSAVTFVGFTASWFEGYSFESRIGLKCRSAYRGTWINGFRSKPVYRNPLNVGDVVSITAPSQSVRCKAPAKYAGYSYIGGVVKPAFHDLYSARFAGTGRPDFLN